MPPAPVTAASSRRIASSVVRSCAGGSGSSGSSSVLAGPPVRAYRSLAPDGGLVNVVSLDVEGGAVQRIHSILNPDKLGHLGPLSDLALRPVRATEPR